MLHLGVVYLVAMTVMYKDKRERKKGKSDYEDCKTKILHSIYSIYRYFTFQSAFLHTDQSLSLLF